jgi:hypothetical protein
MTPAPSGRGGRRSREGSGAFHRPFGYDRCKRLFSFTPIAITGKTSFGDLRAAGYDWLPSRASSEAWGGTATPCAITAPPGLEFSAVKAALEALKP